MPIVQIHLMQGRSDAQKRACAKAVNDAICASLGVAPKNVRIILSEMSGIDYSIGGVPVCDEDDPFGKKS